jgi:hypothetical protein
MAITNPFSIEYGGQSVGGASSTYQLLGPYVIDKSYDSLRLVFDVVVVGTSIANLQSLSDTLETAFQKRLTASDTLKVTMGGNTWTYTHGTTILKTRASISKSGNPETDRAFSRAYTCVVEGELPASAAADGGLRDVEVVVNFEASRQKTVTFRGTYTATSAGDAKARYESNGDTLVAGYLDVVDDAATWELVDESYTLDREQADSGPSPHILNWTRQYLELLAEQSQGSLDDGQIKDHRITFTDLGQYPGDSSQDASRLRRVVGSYDCAVDIEQTTNLRSVYDSKIKPHLRQLFQSNFQPQQFAVEEERISYDETNKRISISFQFIYQSSQGEAVVEIVQSVAFREARNIDYTPTHEEDEFACEADVGFAVLERVWNRTAIAIGEEAPKLRIRERARTEGPIGRFTNIIAGQAGPDLENTSQVNDEGWNVIASTSQVTPQWVGAPNGQDRIRLSVLTETVVERFHSKPGNRTSTPIQRNPTTG